MILGLLVSANSAFAIEIIFDYSLDTNNFFDTQAKRDVLEAAAEQFEVFTDRLDTIVPGSVHNEGTPYEYVDTWTAYFTHPSLPGYQQHPFVDLTIPADVVHVFVGGYSFTDGALAWGDDGSSYPNGSQDFNASVSTRGQPWTFPWTPDDFGPWGGSISFNTNIFWHVGVETGPPYWESDLYSVAIHEIGHVLGFGTSESFDELIDGWSFMGPKSTEVYGSNPPLYADDAHWADGTQSPRPDGTNWETAMDPTIADGTRKPFTRLDYAAMQDIGWQVPNAMFGGLDGDLDGDGFIGLDDLDVLLNHWNQTVSSGDLLAGDPSGDGYVGLDDLDILLNSWNAGTPPSDDPSHNIPEPASAATAIGLLCFTLLTRRQAHLAE